MTTNLNVSHIPPTNWWLRSTWVLNEDIHIGSYTIPKGFISDGVSVPRIFTPLVSPTGKAMKAAFLHDYLLEYKYKDISRSKPDYIFKYSCVAYCNISPTRANIMYLGIRLWSFIKGKW